MKVAFNKEGFSKVPDKVGKTNASCVCVVHTATLRCQIRRYKLQARLGYVVTHISKSKRTPQKTATNKQPP